MPNWCSNNFTVSHEDPAMITKFVECVRTGNLFETFVPLSSGEWDYSTAIDEWGTKWDITSGDAQLDSEDGKSCWGWFETAWGPGILAYEKLSELGFEVDITYIETGMCFAGRFTSPDEDYCVEYNFEDENWRDAIKDDEVLEMLESEYDSWKSWQDEENENAA